MARFTEWSRDNLESVAEEMLAALLRAQQWIERDEETHGRPFGVGNEVREIIQKVSKSN
jgi:hypothetical protein